MPIYWEASKKRWRFGFNRVIEQDRQRVRVRASKLLPAGWSRTQADAYERQRSAELYAAATGVERRRYLITDAVRIFVEERAAQLRGGRKATQELANMMTWYAGKELTDLANVAAAYRRAHAHLAPATVRNRLCYLRSACRYAVKTYSWPVPRPELATPTVRNQRMVYLRPDQQQALFAAFEDDDARALFVLSYEIGARWRSEVLRRKPEDVIRQGRDVWLDCGITKNGRPAWKWVPPAARWTLKYIPFQFGERYFYRRFHAAVQKAGLPAMVPHDQRHSIASDVLAQGGTLADVTAVLGHSSFAAAARYSHLYPEHAKAVLGRLAKGRKR